LTAVKTGLESTPVVAGEGSITDRRVYYRGRCEAVGREKSPGEDGTNLTPERKLKR
jgi:hypothetical protein